MQILPADPERARLDVAEASGFSLHAGVSARGSNRKKLEHLARYIARPPVATERLALTDSGVVRETALLDQTEAGRHRAITWARRPKCVFAIDIERAACVDSATVTGSQ